MLIKGVFFIFISYGHFDVGNGDFGKGSVKLL